MFKVHLSWRGEQESLEVAPSQQLLIGRDPQRCALVLPAHWLPCSRVQAKLSWDGASWWITDGFQNRPSANGTFQIDGSRVDGARFLGAIDDVTLLFGAVPEDRVRLQILGLASAVAASVPPPSPAPVAPSRSPAKPQSSPVASASTSELIIPAGVISIGRHRSCSIRLDDPTVSRLHALIKPEGAGSALVEDRSSNGIHLDGQRMPRLTRILPGADLRIGRARFVWDGQSLQPQGEQHRFGIEVRDLTLPDRLRSLSLSISGGQLVALVGGSGAGKSSLLTTLAGQNPDYGGLIQVNGEDLRRSVGALRPLMGFVPQDDIVHRDLTVQEVLGFAARLRIPDREARRPAVEQVLQLLELDHRRHALVRQLSGGQRKRVNIGMELVADPRLLFLDEPTSGLDPGLDRRMMRLLRQIADRGHTVLVVTHATGNVHHCDQLVFLARGGRLCYSGPPQSCLQHFGISGDFAEVYESLDRDEATLDSLSQQYLNSRSLAPLPSGSPPSLSRPLGGGSSSLRWLLFLPSQLRTLLQRDLLVSWRDRVSLLLNLLTAPVAILLLALAIHRPDLFQVPDGGVTAAELPMAIKVVFVISCACIWTGISSHISAVARERPIYERERSFNLQPLAYVMAKALMIAILAVPQTLLITVIVALLFWLPQPQEIGPALFGYAIAVGLTILASGAMALFLSTLVKDQRQAGSSSPLLLMPQLILSGVLFEIGSLTALYPIVTSRWSVKLLGAYASLEALKLPSVLPGLPKVDVEPYVSTLANVGGSAVMLMLQFAGFSLLALLALSRRRGLRG